MTQWYYLADGREVGPLSSADLKQIADSGRLKPKDMVRRADRTDWHKAADARGLFADGSSHGSVSSDVASLGAQASHRCSEEHAEKSQDDSTAAVHERDMSPPKKPPSSSLDYSANLRDWIRLPLKGKLYAGLWLALILSAIIPTWVNQNRIPADGLQPDVSHGDLREGNALQSDRARNTYNYWCAARGIFTRASTVNQGSRDDEVIGLLESVVAAIDELPAAGVDQDAIICIQDLSDALKRMISCKRQTSSPEYLVEGLARIASGDTLGLPLSVINEQKSIGQQLQSAMSNVSRTRGVLSSRYDVEFPGFN